MIVNLFSSFDLISNTSAIVAWSNRNIWNKVRIFLKSNFLSKSNYFDAANANASLTTTTDPKVGSCKNHINFNWYNGLSLPLLSFFRLSVRYTLEEIHLRSSMLCCQFYILIDVVWREFFHFMHDWCLQIMNNPLDFHDSPLLTKSIWFFFSHCFVFRLKNLNGHFSYRQYEKRSSNR